MYKIYKASILGLAAVLSMAPLISFADNTQPQLLNLNELDSISGGASFVAVVVGAAGTGNTFGVTHTVGGSVNSSALPFSIAGGIGTAAACCGNVSTGGSVAAGTDNRRFQFASGVFGTVSGVGASLSLGVGLAITAF